MHKVKLFFSFIFLGAILTGCGDDDSSSGSGTSSTSDDSLQAAAANEVIDSVMSGFLEEGMGGDQYEMLFQVAQAMKARASILRTKPTLSCSLYTDPPMEMEFPVTNEETGCVQDCSGSEMSFTCAEGASESNTYTCGDNTYTMSDPAITSTIDLSGLTIVGEEMTGEMGVSMEMSGTVTGGDFDSDGTSINCSINVIIDTETDEADFNCDSDESASCTIGDTVYTCAQMEALESDSCDD